MKKIITLDGGVTVEISKLPIGKYAELLKALKQLPGKLGSFTSLDPQSIIKELPNIIADSLDDVVKIIAIATPLNEDQVQDLGLSEIVEIMIGIFEANDYSKVIEQIKKVTAQSAQKASPILTSIQ